MVDMEVTQKVLIDKRRLFAKWITIAQAAMRNVATGTERVVPMSLSAKTPQKHIVLGARGANDLEDGVFCQCNATLRFSRGGAGSQVAAGCKRLLGRTHQS
jgi:hypothetical protein